MLVVRNSYAPRYISYFIFHISYFIFSGGTPQARGIEAEPPATVRSAARVMERIARPTKKAAISLLFFVGLAQIINVLIG
jgi:hypothetical protein